jgi:sugar phosphate isomerase/epimerase
MYLSLHRVTAGGKLSWPDFVALAGRSGYDAVDVDIEAVRELGLSKTRDLLAEHKVRPGACGLPTEFRKDDATFNESLKELGELAGLAAQIGCPRMATWVPPTYEAPGHEMRGVLQRRFTEMGRRAAAHGVRLGMEFISPQHFRDAVTPDRVCVWQMADMLDLCAACGENVGILLDSWHWHHDPDANVDSILKAGRDRIVHVHLNDSADLPPAQILDNQRLLPGEGVIKLSAFIGALRQIGYIDAVSPEIFGRLDGLSPDDAARQSLEASRRALG